MCVSSGELVATSSLHATRPTLNTTKYSAMVVMFVVGN